MSGRFPESIPGHGRICDQYEVGEYRDMIAIIRDRVQAMINNQGATVEQVKGARLTADFDSRDHRHVCRGCLHEPQTGPAESRRVEVDVSGKSTFSLSERAPRRPAADAAGEGHRSLQILRPSPFVEAFALSGSRFTPSPRGRGSQVYPCNFPNKEAVW